MSSETSSNPKSSRDFKKPDYWTNDPVPQPAAPKPQTEAADGDHDGVSPTRYGDWVKDGIAIDF
ncbi:DUF1674 domain-containing protein [Altererythrobacter indicus]|uniref:DUF1674 domain-containing protein n=1 Tax=Altericroceibacterium indicum TaxID=374177 RepID=A0A845ACA5_9SPHN|nr:DUF1674 domain-containing protein [Altericroceibacterium indicum]MXP26186.1 DUF1674 domain-containing protein [Altericroceibacterium indicum]